MTTPRPTPDAPTRSPKEGEPQLQTTIEEAIKGHSHLSQQDYDSLVRDAMLWRQTVRQPRVDIEWVQKALAYASEGRGTNTIKPDLLANAINKYFAPHSQPAEAQHDYRKVPAWDKDRETDNFPDQHPNDIQSCGHRLANYVGDEGGTFYCEVCAAYQRGAQAMAEKAGQLVMEYAAANSYKPELEHLFERLAQQVRSIAGAATSSEWKRVFPDSLQRSPGDNIVDGFAVQPPQGNEPGT